MSSLRTIIRSGVESHQLWAGGRNPFRIEQSEYHIGRMELGFMVIWHALRGAGELAMGLPVVVPSRGWNDHRLLSVNPLGWSICGMRGIAMVSGAAVGEMSNAFGGFSVCCGRGRPLSGI